MGTRAGIVVTGTEVLTGRVADRNGPWLAEQLRLLGVDVGHVVVVGDRPEDLEAALRFLVSTEVGLIVTSGGLGPTADDLTAEVVAAFQGRPTAVDPELEARVGAIVERLTARRRSEDQLGAVDARPPRRADAAARARPPAPGRRRRGGGALRR